MAKALSIEDTYQWMQRFITREWRLLLPVAFAFLALPLIALDLLVPPRLWVQLQGAVQSQHAELVTSVMSWLLPVMIVIALINLAGGLAITAMALLPGVAVREALTLALRRLPTLIGALLLIALAEFVIVILVLAATFALRNAALQSLAYGILLGLAIFAGVRLIPLAAMVTSRRVGPIAALRESWLLTRGAFWSVLGAMMIYMVGGIIVILALSSALGAVLLLLGKLIGAPDLGFAVNAVLQRGLGAVFGAGFQLLGVSIFRQLGGANRGI